MYVVMAEVPRVGRFDFLHILYLKHSIYQRFVAFSTSYSHDESRESFLDFQSFFPR